MADIIFYAASEINIPKEKIGGAETGAKRTYNFLIEAGYSVDYIPKATTYYGKLNFIKEIICTYFKLKKKFKYNKGAVFYITAFYKRQSFIEFKFLKMAKKFHLKTIYEPKNGSFVTTYNSSNIKYKKRILNCLNLSDLVFCQGQEYVDFVSKKSSAFAVYIPNYVNNFKAPHLIRNNINVYKICFFGRITKSKNILLILEVVKLIKNDNKKVICKIIGASSNEYKTLLLDYIKKNKLENEVLFYDRMPLSEIKKEIENFDYFLFPSEEKEEGHSNSLTEAMSLGLIPIVSNAGFNRTVVGNDAFVIDDLEAIKFKEKIYYLSNDLYNYKIMAIKRIENNYTSNIVINRQLDSIKKLLEE